MYKQFVQYLHHLMHTSSSNWFKICHTYPFKIEKDITDFYLPKISVSHESETQPQTYQEKFYYRKRADN